MCVDLAQQGCGSAVAQVIKVQQLIVLLCLRFSKCLNERLFLKLCICPGLGGV